MDVRISDVLDREEIFKLFDLWLKASQMERYLKPLNTLSI